MDRLFDKIRPSEWTDVQDIGNGQVAILGQGDVKNTVSGASEVIKSGRSRYVVEELTINDGASLEIEDGAYLEIG